MTGGVGVGTAICLVKGINSLICAVVGGGRRGRGLSFSFERFRPETAANFPS